MVPDALLVLANLGRPRRPSRASARCAEPVLPDAAGAARQLAGLGADAITEADVPALRELQRVATQAAEALRREADPDWALLNALARGSTAHAELINNDGDQQRQLVWTDASPAAGLARRLIDELADIDPSRLRSCARSECGLLLYDTTRSRTRRWHAEDPCGWRERQRLRRRRQAAGGSDSTIERSY